MFLYTFINPFITEISQTMTVMMNGIHHYQKLLVKVKHPLQQKIPQEIVGGRGRPLLKGL